MITAQGGQSSSLVRNPWTCRSLPTFVTNPAHSVRLRRAFQRDRGVELNQGGTTWIDFRAPRLRVALLVATGLIAASVAGPAAAAPTDLFISEYVEGSSNNKALELYNGTGATVTLTGGYDVQIFANGSATATATIPLVGSIPNGDVFVLARSAAVAAILAVADQTTTNFLFSGNDAVALRRDGAILDVVGQIGVDPGTEWGSGDASTLDNTVRRKPAVEAGDPNGADAFDPALEWNGFPLDSFDGLGSHSLGGGGGGGGGGGSTAPDCPGRRSDT